MHGQHYGTHVHRDPLACEVPMLSNTRKGFLSLVDVHCQCVIADTNYPCALFRFCSHLLRNEA
jgi:hypothetical protein